MKKVMITTMFALACMFAVVGMNGCSTSTPGVTNTAGSYSALLDSTPDKVTNAAKRTLQDMKFLDIVSAATKINGRVTAKDAQNNTITINVDQAGDNVSKMSIRYGITGDEGISNQIFEKTKKNLSWF